MAEVLGTNAAAIKVTAAAETDIGRRQHNEDAVQIRADLGLYVLADGAGGENAGNVASTLACASIAHFFEDTQSDAQTMPPFDDLGLATAARRLAIAVQRANRDVIEIAKSHDRYRGMGTTVVAAHVMPESPVIHLAHVGDSRCYRLREGRIEQLTQDHTLINDVLEMKPDIPNAQAARLPRNVITRALGMAESVRVSVKSTEIAPGDRYVLCSDGLTDVLDDVRILEILQNKQSAEGVVRRLIEAAKEAGAVDNVAAMVLVCDAPPGSLPFRQRQAPVMRVRRESAPQMSVPERDPDLSWPEIIVMTEEPEDINAPAVAVVPRESTTPGLLDAVDDFFESVSPHRPGHKRKYHTLGYEEAVSAGQFVPGKTSKVAVAPPPPVGPPVVAPPPPPPAAPPPPPRMATQKAPPPPSPPRAPRPPTRPPAPVIDEVLCSDCGTSYDGALPVCPDCGAER